MGTKTISIKTEVYEKLIALKVPGESFSDQLDRLTSLNTGIMEFAGAWSDISDKEADKMFKVIEQGRKGSRLKKIVKMMEE
ncbi:antitoxin [archaeon]|nr:antitoxin [archaeon]MBT6762009.1 antitoxin [archaeon]